jgi:hypothetical protein
MDTSLEDTDLASFFLDGCCQPSADRALATSSIADITTPVAV